MNTSIAGIIYLQERFLVGRRIDGGQMGGRWEFPGGKVEPGETPEQTIVREFREELGLDATPGECIATAKFENNAGPVDLLAFRVYLALDQKVTLSEHTELSWMTIDEIEQLDLVDSDRLLVPALREWSAHDPDR